MGVLVVVDERELELAPVREDEDPGLVHQLILGDPDRGGHLPARPVIGLPDGSASQDPTEGCPVLVVQTLHVNSTALSSLAHGSLLASAYGVRYA
jgi:hypothetical protein